MKKLLPLLIFLATTPIFAQTINIVSYPPIVVTDHTFNVVVNAYTLASTNVTYKVCVDVKNPTAIELEKCTAWLPRVLGNYTFTLFTKENATYTITARLLKNASGTVYVVDTDSVYVKSLSTTYVEQYLQNIKNSLSYLQDNVSLIKSIVNRTNETLNEKIVSINKSIENLQSTINQMLYNQSITAKDLNNLTMAYNLISDDVKHLWDYIDKTNQTMNKIYNNIRNNISEINNNITKVKENTNNSIEEIWKYIHEHESEWKKDKTLSTWWVLEHIQSAITKLKDWFLSVINNFERKVEGEFNILFNRVNNLEDKYNKLDREVYILNEKINELQKKLNVSVSEADYIGTAKYLCRLGGGSDTVNGHVVVCKEYSDGYCSCYYRINNTVIKHYDVYNGKVQIYYVSKLR